MYRYLKGQSAIETAATYGWMIVAAALIGGTMYTQIGGKECQLGTNGFSAPFPVIEETYQYQNGTLIFQVRNPRKDPVKINEIDIMKGGEIVGTIEAGVKINGQANSNIYTNRFSTSENCITRDIRIDYSSGELEGLSTNGTLKGKLALVPIRALFNVNTTFVDTGQVIKFNASPTESENSIVHYNWSFGDGETATGKVVTHSYSDEAVFEARLTVEDSEGITAQETVQIFVGGLLTRSGGNFSELNVGESIATRCIGSNCRRYNETDETVVTSDGDYLVGTLFTERLLMLQNSLCVTDYVSAGTDEGCKIYREGEEKKVSPENRKIFGSIKIPSIIPQSTGLCIGDRTQC